VVQVRRAAAAGRNAGAEQVSGRKIAQRAGGAGAWYSSVYPE